VDDLFPSSQCSLRLQEFDLRTFFVAAAAFRRSRDFVVVYPHLFLIFCLYGERIMILHDEFSVCSFLQLAFSSEDVISVTREHSSWSWNLGSCQMLEHSAYLRMDQVEGRLY
jgi:hypothetical protein